MTDDSNTILVRLKKRTTRELKKYGEFGQSYDDLVWKLIKSYRLSLKLKRKESG
jgi:hypothetical protein